MRLLRLLIPGSWRDAVVRDLEDEARARGKGAFWLAGQLLWVGLRLQPVVNGDSVISDLRYAIASLWRSKAFALGAVLTFALGIGVNVAVFSVVDRMMIRSLPYGDPDTLVVMGEHLKASASAESYDTLAASHVIEARRRLQGIADLAVVDEPLYYRATASGEGPLQITEGSANLLSVLGVRPWLGPGLTEEDTRNRHLGVVLSYEAWQTHFGGRADVIGRQVWRLGQPVDIVGVLPRNFYPPPTVAGRSDGVGLSLAALQPSAGPTARESRPFVRLKPGVSIAAAEAELNALLGGVGATSVFRFTPIREAMFGRYATYSRLVILAAGLVLLMCCANLVSLMLVRARARQYDVAIQMAMGASRGRVLRALVLESLVLAGAGAAVALMAVTSAHRALLAFVPEIFSRYAEAPTDPRVLAFSIIATLVCAVGAGVGPGLRATSKNVATVLQSEGRGRGGSRQRRGGFAVLVAEAMVAALLVTGAVLTARSLVGLMRIDVGFDPEGLHVVSAFIEPRPRDTGALFKQQQDVLEAIRHTKDVRTAAAADVLPIQGAGNLFVQGAQGAFTWRVSDGFFETMGMRVLAGRPFTTDEVRTGARVAVLGESGLRLVWPGVSAADAIGRVLSLEGLAPAQVVGVVADIRSEPAATPHSSLYLPLTAEKFRGMRFIARTAPDLSVPVEDLRSRITAFAPPQHVGASPVSGRLRKSLSDQRFRATLFGAFAAAALLLAGVGLYAVTAFEVRQRRTEIGIRLALGATRQRVLAHILRDAVWPVAIGSAAGLVVAWWSGRFLQSFLHGIDARGAGTLLMVGAVLVVTAIVAAWIPARRASQVDPATVLRAD